MIDQRASMSTMNGQFALTARIHAFVGELYSALFNTWYAVQCK